MRSLLKAIVSILLFLFLTSCNNRNEGRELIIFHAGSLSVPLRKMATLYEAENPGVKVLLESAGSVVAARKITELKRPCDIMASADYFVIDNMLIPEYADWNIRFASNEMVICYSENSKYVSELNAQSWPEILLREDVIYSRADPNDDPCGYRTIFSIMLTEEQTDRSGLTEKFLKKNANYIRPKGIDLVALIQSGSVDYIFEYKSIAIQHGLSFIGLEPSVNLAEPSLQDIYNSVFCSINGSEPGKEVVVQGDFIVYGVTILRNAVNKKDAEGFVKLMLSEKGQEILSADGQNPIVPPLKTGDGELPESLIPFFVAENMN